MKKTLYTALMSLPAFLLIACGGSSSSGSSEGTAFYVDSAVEGVTVTCGATTSVTDNLGSFIYVSGDTCLFSIGDIILRQQSNIIQGDIVFENNLPVAQLLQSFDNDNNPSNGIRISAEVVKLLIANGISTLPENDAELERIVGVLQDQGISFFGAYVSKAEAQVHLDETENTLNPAPVAPEPTPVAPAPEPVAVVTEPDPVPVVDTTSGAS